MEVLDRPLGQRQLDPGGPFAGGGVHDASRLAGAGIPIQLRVNTLRPMPGRSGTRENRCPEEPPQRIANSLPHGAIRHIAKPAISRYVSLVRSAVRRPKPAPAEFPRSRSVPRLNGPPHAANARRLRGAGARRSRFLSASSRNGRNCPAKSAEAARSDPVAGRHPAARRLPPQRRNPLTPGSLLRGC